MGNLVTWQEPIVVLIVGLAVVALYRHIRRMLGLGRPRVGASCHGCEDCSDDAEVPAPVPPQGAADRRP